MGNHSVELALTVFKGELQNTYIVLKAVNKGGTAESFGPFGLGIVRAFLFL